MAEFLTILIIFAIGAGAGYLFARSKFVKPASLDVPGDEAAEQSPGSSER